MLTFDLASFVEAHAVWSRFVQKWDVRLQDILYTFTFRLLLNVC